jgi:hypothetical protein
MIRSLIGRTLVAGALVATVARPAGAEICLRVDVRAAGPATPPLLRLMIEETSSIWAQYGVRIVRSPDRLSARGCQAVDGSVEVNLDRRRGSVAQQPEVVLGSVRLQSRAIDGCPIHIDYEATARLLGTVPAQRLVAIAGHPDIGTLDIGRALGRVLAHEIGHVVLQAPLHQRHGLMRATFTSDELAGARRDDFTLSDAELARLRTRERELKSVS